MKTLFKSFILIAGFFLAIQSAHAGLFGWTTTVSAIDTEGYPVRDTVVGSTFAICEFRRQQVVISYTSAGYSGINAPYCSPAVVTLPREFQLPELIRWPIPWPWPGPVCLSCPYLELENIKNIYPQDHLKVEELVKRYNIDVYNKELMRLQRAFDLEGFEKEMFELERSIQRQKR